MTMLVGQSSFVFVEENLATLST